MCGRDGVDYAVLEKSLLEKLMPLALLLLLLCGAGLVAQATWQLTKGKDVRPPSEEGPLTDELSQREMHLQRQALHLAETMVVRTDLRLAVTIDDTKPGARQITLLVHRQNADPILEQKLREVIWSGLALRKDRGDRIVIQFHEFAATHSGGPEGEQLPTLSFAGWRAAAGVGLVLLVLLALWLQQRRQNRDSIKSQEINDYQEQLLALKEIAQQEPARVAGVLSAWLNDERH